MTPLAPRKSHKTLAEGISLIWRLGTIAALPAALFSRLYRVTSDVDEKKIYSCILIFPDGLPGQSHLDYIYNFFFFTYLLPLACMAVCYIRMGRSLWRNTPGEVT